MKVLIAHELFPPQVAGGGERVVYKIAKFLQESGVEVKVFTTGNPSLREFEGIETVRIPVHRYGMNFLFPLILKHARDCDVIHANNYNAALPSYIASRLAKKPCICHIHELYGNKWLEMRGKVLGRLSAWVEKIQVKHGFEKFLFFSEWMRKFAVSVGIPEERTVVIPPGVDFKRFKVGRKEPFVLFVGNLIRRKGVYYLIEVARELKDVSFKIVGKGKERGNLERIAPPNVEFLGYVSDEELVELYSKALIFCLPSIGEGFGLVILEAMASGCAIVSTVPLDYEGIFLPHLEKELLVKSISTLIENKAMAIKMGRRNREISKEYSWKRFVRRLLECYEEVVG